MIWGLIAARLGAETKKRLEPALGPAVRRQFAQAMLSDVISALLESDRLAGVCVLAGDQEAAELASHLGALVVADSGEGLNRAVISGMELTAERGADGVLVAMGDLPLLTVGDVDRVIEALPARGVVAAPSRDGTGTNLLGLRPPGLIPTHFGSQSLAAHRSEAGQAGIPWREVESGGAALDVDTPEDLEHLQRRLNQAPATGPNTRKALRNAGL